MYFPPFPLWIPILKNKSDVADEDHTYEIHCISSGAVPKSYYFVLKNRKSRNKKKIAKNSNLSVDDVSDAALDSTSVDQVSSVSGKMINLVIWKEMN